MLWPRGVGVSAAPRIDGKNWGDGFDIPVVAPANAGVGAVYTYETGAPFSCKMSGAMTGGQFGRTLAEAADVDKDRTSDFLVGQPEAGVGGGMLFERPVLR